MSTRVRLRKVSEEEEQAVKRLAGSRKAGSAVVQRARMIAYMIADPKLMATEAGFKAGFRSRSMGAKWVRRFNERGVAGLQDQQRPGRVPVHSKEVHSALINLALQKPKSLGYPYELWTLERLQQAFEERQQVHLSDSTIWEWLDAEGLQWKRQQRWFHEPEKHDPEFVEKRGPS